MYTEIQRCRICGNTDLVPVLDLGTQSLSGVFPRSRDEAVSSGPLELVKCHGGATTCGLLQLRQSYNPTTMFGDNYGYRSGLNRTMVTHLHDTVRRATAKVTLERGDCVVDIGSNDATLLRTYPQLGVDLIGFDPAGAKFRLYYPDYVTFIPHFFSAMAYRDACGTRKAKIVTSIAMFYDLEDPMRFMSEVYEILADDGIWVTEQSYMPMMLANRSYDTVCHEHLEYYGLRQLQWMAERTGFRIVDVEMNDVNGGSFSVVLAKAGTSYTSADIDSLLVEEPLTLEPYLRFAHDSQQSRDELRAWFAREAGAKKLILGLGASTKGNIILQYCGITDGDLPCIGEVNSDKFGGYTPGTAISIIPETDMLAMRPDYVVVLPWHFRDFFLTNPKYAGVSLVFPLPVLDVVNRA